MQNFTIKREIVKCKNRKGDIADVEVEKPIHIVVIYILGHSLCGIDKSVVYYSPQAKDAEGNIIENVSLNPFFKYLSHDSIVILIPHLRKNARTRVENFLEIFDQTNIMPDNEHFLLLDDIDNKPDGYNTVIRQLVSAMAEEKVKTAMDFEDQFAEDLENWMELEEIGEEQKEKLAEQKAQLSQQYTQLSAFAKTLFSMRLSRKDISEKINISLEQLNKLLDF